VEAKILKRNYIGFDTEEEYVETAKNRHLKRGLCDKSRNKTQLRLG
jgi:DNA modification methylase